MAEKYIFGSNVFQDYLISILLRHDINIDISTKETKEDLNNVYTFILSSIYQKSDVVYLDFKIKKKKNNCYKIVGKNFISALWFSGIFPINIDETIYNNFFISDNKRYTYNKKKNKLCCSVLNN